MSAFNKPYILKYHLRTHIQNFPYVCHICQSGYSRGELLSRHSKKEHPNYKNCKRCSQSFPEAKFPDHVCIEKRPYVCQNCGSGFGRIGGLNDHSKSCNDYSCCSTSLREYQYEFKGSYYCRTCKVHFSQLGQLIKHKIKNHRSFAPSNGSQCTDVYPKGKYVYYNVVKRQRRSVLPFPMPYSCRFCKKAFQSDKELQEHLSSKHPFRIISGRHPYKCITCGAYCVTEKHLKKHKAICTSKKRQKPKVKCEKCGLLLCSSSLKRHMKVHANKINRVAEHTSPSLQEKHARGSLDTIDGTSSAAETSVPSAETQNDDGLHREKFKCGHCDVEYPTLGEVCIHSRACHTNKATLAVQKPSEKTKECKMCHQSFSEVSKFHSHLQEVHNYKECMFCQKMFSNMYSRNRHIKKFHSEKSETESSTKRARVETASSDKVQPASTPETTVDASSEVESSLSTSQSGSDVQQCTQMVNDVTGSALELTSNQSVGAATKTSSTDRRVFECDQCGKVYKYYIYLVKHYTKHHPL